MKRVFSAFLCIIMLFSLFPVSVLAVEDVPEEEQLENEETLPEDLAEGEPEIPDDEIIDADLGELDQTISEPEDDPSVFNDGLDDSGLEPENPVPDELPSVDPEPENPVPDELPSVDPEPEGQTRDRSYGDG